MLRAGSTGRARTRIVAAFVVMSGVVAVVSVMALHSILAQRLDARVRGHLEQEVLELDRLRADGRDPATGGEFATLESLLDVYFARNVPTDEEAMLAFVDGVLHRSAIDRYPLSSLPDRVYSIGEDLSRSESGRTAVGGFVETTLGDSQFRAVPLAHDGQTGSFIVTILPRDDLDSLEDVRTVGLLVVFLGMVVAAAGAWFVVGRILAPVRMLTETAQSISESDLTARIDVRGDPEAAEMARSFNAMLDRLETVFADQRAFAENVSHELRDPLTICRGHLELMNDDDPERSSTIALVVDELDRIARMVDDLHVLAARELPTFIQTEPFDLQLFTHELVLKASALAPRRWVVDGASRGVVDCDRHRLTEAVMNLAHNAVMHTGPSDTIAIGASSNGQTVRLWVRDTGIGIADADRRRVFERFERGTGARARYRGAGLGLSIVTAIAEAHGGHIELVTELGQGATFTIVLPDPSRGASEHAGTADC